MSTYTQLYIHIIFAVKGRESLIESSWEEELYKYISGIVRNKGQKMLAIGGIPNHIHFLIGMNPSCSISDLVREIKKSSNQFIKEKKLCKYNFQWQSGYGAFSIHHSDLTRVIQYISNQKNHHANKSFKEEYIEFLTNYEIEYQEEYLFEWIE